MSFLPLLGWCALTAMSADTISVNTARCTPAMEFHAPYQTDSLNLQGKPFDIQSVMKENASLIVKGNDFKKSDCQRYNVVCWLEKRMSARCRLSVSH